MSFDRFREEDSNSEIYSQITHNSTERRLNSSDSQPIVINVYQRNPFLKFDKVVQTDSGSSRSFVILSASYPQEEPEKKDLATNSNLETSQGKIAIQTPARETKRLMSDEKKDDKPMDLRKFHPNDGKCYKNSKTASDVERMKLQAELKATEEIAKLKQTIIEKRLALELATIQNKVDCSQSSHHSPSHAELRALEDYAKKKQNTIQANLTKELECLEFQKNNLWNLPSPSSPPPKQTPSPPSSPRIVNPFKTESSCSVLTSFRGLGVLDKKFAMDKSYPVHPTLKPPTNFFPVNERSEKSTGTEKLGSPHSKYLYRPPDLPQPPYPTESESRKAHSAWKSAMTKIIRKMKSKPQNPWED